MKDCLISVVVPVFNGERWLERCIDSIRRQTWTHLEIIVVDDGSTDGSAALARELAAADGRIRVAEQENAGASAARNLGIRMALGEYIGFVDCDDTISSGMYSRLLDFGGREGLAMVQASRDEVDEEGRRLADVCVPPEGEVIMSEREFVRELLLHRGDASFCTKLVKASLFREYQFPEGVLNEDFELLIRMLPEVKRVGIVPEQYYHVLVHEDSTTRKRDQGSFSRVFADIVDNADMMERVVARDYPELNQEVKRFALYQRLDYLLHIPISQMRRGNDFYRQVIRYLWKNVPSILGNPYLGKKNKLYLLLFAAAPKTIRELHALSKRRT